MGDIIEHGHGERKERGDLINLFAEEQALILTNTWLKLPDIYMESTQKQTWTYNKKSDSLYRVIYVETLNFRFGHIKLCRNGEYENL